MQVAGRNESPTHSSPTTWPWSLRPVLAAIWAQRARGDPEALPVQSFTESTKYTPVNCN